MLPVRLIGHSVKSSMNHLTVDGLRTPSMVSIRTISNNDWINQTVDTIESEGVSFTETRKHKMDGDTCVHQTIDHEQYESIKKIDVLDGKQDGRLNVYDPSTIGLSGVMQTNVPEPFDPSTGDNQDTFLIDHSVSLNMPGGTNGQKTKYLSGQLNMLDIDQSRH